MTDYKFGDIVLVPFPFTDQTTTKKRPAVIVSSNAYIQNRPDIVIMAVTSQSYGSGYFGDVRIQNWQQAGLLKPSVIKPILTTVEKGLVIRKLGNIRDNDQAALNENLQSILGE
jgi:mRNA interferase MazF